ncbi:hypothetical protein ACLOJK_010794 [Asimina triloba]
MACNTYFPQCDKSGWTFQRRGEKDKKPFDPCPDAPLTFWTTNKTIRSNRLPAFSPFRFHHSRSLPNIFRLGAVLSLRSESSIVNGAGFPLQLIFTARVFVDEDRARVPDRLVAI